VTEPIFNQTVEKLRSRTPPRPEKSTDVSDLIEAAGALSPIAPAGIIFHISRCGSTFLANVLKTGARVVVLSEARPVVTFFRRDIFECSLFHKDQREDVRRTLLNCVLTLYGHALQGSDAKPVIKCNAANTRHIRLIRAIWPAVPSVIVIRNPLEVMVSNIAKPAGWLRHYEEPSVARRPLRVSDVDGEVASLEEYCARGIGRFCAAAQDAIDEGCRVVDYSHLNVPRIHDIARMFGITLPSADSPEFQRALVTYSKDADGQAPYVDDSRRKQTEASESQRRLTQEWALPAYLALKSLERW
jgi:hypothetical protein